MCIACPSIHLSVHLSIYPYVCVRLFWFQKPYLSICICSTFLVPKAIPSDCMFVVQLSSTRYIDCLGLSFKLGLFPLGSFARQGSILSTFGKGTRKASGIFCKPAFLKPQARIWPLLEVLWLQALRVTVSTFSCSLS